MFGISIVQIDTIPYSSTTAKTPSDPLLKKLTSETGLESLVLSSLCNSIIPTLFI